MKVAFFSTKSYEQEYFTACNAVYRHDITFFEVHLSTKTLCLAKNYPVICPFVNDRFDAEVLKMLSKNGTQLLALRSAGFNHVDLNAAEQHGITVVRVPVYSPYAVAEHTVNLMLSLNRKTCRAYNRVREGNFSLDGLMGFDMYGKTVGIIGTGRIGKALASILRGFGCHLLAYDPSPNEVCKKLGVCYTSLGEIYKKSDIITLHCPLTPETHHLIDDNAIKQMKTGVMLINTSRGTVVDTCATIRGLKAGKIGYLGLDVYEEEGDLFFEDLSNCVIQDDTFTRLLTFPNVIITAHQAFFTKEALENIAKITLQNIQDFENGALKAENIVQAKKQLVST